MCTAHVYVETGTVRVKRLEAETLLGAVMNGNMPCH